MGLPPGGFGLARLFGSAVISQIVLSAANFAVGILLVRHAPDVEYGSYVLALNALMLLASLQSSFFNPPLAARLSVADLATRAELVGGFQRSQRLMLPWLLVPVMAIDALLLAGGRIAADQAALVLAAALTAIATLNREYFRMVLSAYRRTHLILGADLLHAALLVGGVAMALLTPHPAIGGMVALACASLASGALLARRLRAFEPWNPAGHPGLLSEIAHKSVWSTAGAAIHWTFSQGFMYVVAWVLNPVAVAALAATRLTLMPVNVLSSGVTSLLLPMCSRWLAAHGVLHTWRRLCLLALGMAVAALCYFMLMWVLRDWIFTRVLHKSLVNRDALLLWWGAVFLSMAVRDQLISLLVSRGEFHALTVLTLLSAVTSLLIGYAQMRTLGVIGALHGLLAGEVISVGTIILLSVRVTRRPQPTQAATAAAPD